MEIPIEPAHVGSKLSQYCGLTLYQDAPRLGIGRSKNVEKEKHLQVFPRVPGQDSFFLHFFFLRRLCGGRRRNNMGQRVAETSRWRGWHLLRHVRGRPGCNLLFKMPRSEVSIVLSSAYLIWGAQRDPQSAISPLFAISYVAPKQICTAVYRL